MKTCTTCGVPKSLDSFYRRPGKTIRYRSSCKSCEVERKTDYRLKNPSVQRRASKKWQSAHVDRVKAYRQGHRLKSFGITVSDFDAMFDAQCGLCAICNDPLKEWRGRAVDHCHATGQVRAILCGRCNKALGAFNDSVTVLHAAAEYLAYHETRNQS